MKRFLLLLAAVALLVAGLAPTAAAAEAPDTVCPTEGWTEVEYVSSARNPRLNATQTTTVTVTAIHVFSDQIEVHYVAQVVTHDAYAIGDDGRRGVTTEHTFPLACIDRRAGGGEPPPEPEPGDWDPLCGSPARCELIDTIRKRHAEAIARGRG